jgi:hypothetical protein
MEKWSNELSRAQEGRSPNGQKTHEEMFNIPGLKENANQNHLKVPFNSY